MIVCKMNGYVHESCSAVCQLALLAASCGLCTYALKLFERTITFTEYFQKVSQKGWLLYVIFFFLK
jgi:hypothetical protein